MEQKMYEFQTILGPIRGTCYSEAHLIAKFQIWARIFNVTEYQVSAFLFCDKPERQSGLLKGRPEMWIAAEECKAILGGLKFPEDFGSLKLLV